MDPTYSSVARQIRKKSISEQVPLRDFLFVQRVIEHLSYRNLSLELDASCGSVPSRALECADACNGYLAGKQPRLTTLKAALSVMAAGVASAPGIDAADRRSVSLALAPSADGRALATGAERSLRDLQQRIGPGYEHGLLNILRSLPESPETWSPAERAVADATAAELAGHIVALGSSEMGAIRALIAGLHRSDRADRLGASVNDIVGRPKNSYTVIVPISSNKPLAAAERLGVEYLDDPRTWRPAEGDRMSGRWQRHVRAHFGGERLQAIRVDVQAVDPYAAGAEALTRLQSVADAYQAASAVLRISVRKPFLALLPPRLTGTMELYEVPASSPAYPLRVSDSRVASIARYLSLAKVNELPVLRTGLAWVALEAALAGDVDQPFPWICERLPRALLPALLRRTVMNTVQLGIAELASLRIPDADLQALRLSVGSNPRGRFDPALVADVLDRLRDVEPTGDVPGLATHWWKLSPLTRQKLRDAGEMAGSPAAVARTSAGYERGLRGILVDMYLLRNSAFHTGVLTGVRENGIATAALRIADVLVEVLAYWAPRTPGASAAEIIERLHGLGTQLVDGDVTFADHLRRAPHTPL